MPRTTEYYRQLLASYINNNCTPQQADEVMQFLQQDVSNKLLLQQLQAEFNRAMEIKEPVPTAISKKLQQRLMQAILPAPVIPFYNRLFFKITAAVFIIIALGAGWFLFVKNKPAKQVVYHKTRSSPVKSAAGHKKAATITLANGEQIILSDTAGAAIIQQNNTHVVKLTGNQVAYDTAALLNTEASYHTLTVPAGCKMIQLMLADGSTVWLNTASTLQYPAAFTGNERNVQLTGEAYFEVKHDANRAFTVNTKNIKVHVLGTGFNISAYNDEEQSNVVLVKGSVALTAEGQAGFIKKQLVPGNMASFETGARKLSVTTVSTEEYTSWRKGYLIFKQTPLEQIIKRLSRYYDVSINTDVLAHSEETFSGRLDFQKNLDDLMNLVCMGTSFIYLPKEHTLSFKK
jgi:transmembrane sensor